MTRIPVMSPLIDNLCDGETVYQRCLLLTGCCNAHTNDDAYISITCTDAAGNSVFPIQQWPVAEGRFKALLILSPGVNVITLKQHASGKELPSTQISLTYTALTQLPPLHLAIMIAKDSPLVIDCPPHKAGGISSAHADLDAAIAKFRKTAYMWQALTAEDMRSKGLGRRSFRLEEEWTADTLSKDFVNAAHDHSLYSETNSAMRSTAKIHLIRTQKTVAEVRNAQIAQQNPSAVNKNILFDYFLAALKTHGGPFTSSARPIVAGLILDSHYSLQQSLIVGHAALGCHNADAVSLGMFGSHLTYAWPRFLEEVTACLLDTAIPGETVGNDNGECGTMWESCSIGQGAFLHEAGHAFGAPHTTGIMARGYAQDWPKTFLAKTAYCAKTRAQGDVVIDGETKNGACWDLRDALSFKQLLHFRLPSDQISKAEIATATPYVELSEKQGPVNTVIISCPAGIARIQINGETQASPTIAAPVTTLELYADELDREYGRNNDLELNVLGMNGRERVVKDLWKIIRSKPFIRIPGSDIVLKKKSFKSTALESAEGDINHKFWEWAVLLNKRGKNGMTRAKSFEMRIGLILDGGIVRYEDGSKEHTGPNLDAYGKPRRFGGHASKTLELPKDVSITKIEVSQRNKDLAGLKTYLSNGDSAGATEGYGLMEKAMLEPGPNDYIIGFFGRSDWCRGFGGIQEFGIITAPKNVDLPDAIYDMKELKNTDGGIESKSGNVYDDEDDDEDDDDDED